MFFLGRHLVHVYYDGQEAVGSPYPIEVYDVSYGKIIRHAFGPIQLREPYMFQGEYPFHTGHRASRVSRPLEVRIQHFCKGAREILPTPRSIVASTREI